MLTMFTDTDTDFTPQDAKEYGFKLISMPYVLKEKEIKPYVDFDKFDSHAFYQQLRDGVMPHTSAISTEEYLNYFEPEFAAGNDILYIHFSAAMSCTFDNLNKALEILKNKYPERKYYSIDTKAITICSYNIVKAIGDLFKQGKSLEYVLDWAKTEVDHYAVYFYASDLRFFARSGRISNLSAVAGTLIGIHPVLTMTGKGVMTTICKVRGEKATLRKIVDFVEELAEDIKNHRVIIGHADCLPLAQKLATMLKERLGNDLPIEYCVVNPTAGSHCGPDCIGVTFHAKRR